jgi:hypothetical protein
MEARKEPWLAGALEVAFRDLAKKKLYQGKSRDALINPQVRLFDSFDILLPKAELSQLATDYFTFLGTIKYFANAEGEIADLETQAQMDCADKLLTDMIDIAILEFFDQPKHIRHELSKILNWGDLASKINPIKLVCDYIGGIFQIIYDTYPKSIEANMPARQCAEKYINKHYKILVVNTLLERSFISKAEADASLGAPKQEESIFKSPAVIAATTVFSLAALAGIAFGIFAAITSSRNRHQEEKKEDEATHLATKGAK